VGQTRRSWVSPFTPVSLRLLPPFALRTRRPIWARARGDNLLVGPGTPRGRNADSGASSGLGDRHGGRGSPARSSSEGRARERASLHEMGQGSECGCGRCSKKSWGAWVGDVAGDLGVRACCWSTAGHGEGGADRGVPRCSKREQASEENGSAR
jgi:hypothetical protein